MIQFYHKIRIYILNISVIIFLSGCNIFENNSFFFKTALPENTLDYVGSPTSYVDRNPLAFSDQGAWFAYGFPSDTNYFGGFSGPFLMTQENGIWSSKSLSHLILLNHETKTTIDWTDFSVSRKSFNSHLEQIYKNDQLEITLSLYYSSPHSAIIITQIKNLSDQAINLQAIWTGKLLSDNLHISQADEIIIIKSDKSTAKGYIQAFNYKYASIESSDSSYSIGLNEFELKKNDTKQLILSQTFIFPEYDIESEQLQLRKHAKLPFKYLNERIKEKEKQLNKLYKKLDQSWKISSYKDLISKSVLTLQNNWRIPAGEIKHSGLFPSYHYIWFHGFWAWDSWKHAAALAHFNTDLAKEQIKAMYDFMDEDGFIADCVYRDTTIESHNYRNTKPPLSAWAIWKVYEQDKDERFLKKLYQKLLKQHYWWYANRDHDKDGLCEYGSTDGTLIAAKWESGMDNAVRFDDSQILKNSEGAFSLNQESVDLNAYLYAEKKYLIKIANLLEFKEDARLLTAEASQLKTQIQTQFYDSQTAWFYDTSIDGDTFIKVMGCEGWIPLWAEVATEEQAKAVKNNMMNPNYFNTKVPFQTLTANHPKFEPDGGYWRGPNWLDQSYFGVKGLKNYGYTSEANDAIYKIIHNAKGVLEKGKTIRENYNPITGEGLESESFSWSAAHYILLLINE